MKSERAERVERAAGGDVVLEAPVHRGGVVAKVRDFGAKLLK